MLIDKHFPTVIGTFDCPIDTSGLVSYIERNYKDGGFIHLNIFKEGYMPELTRWISRSVNEFAQAHNHKHYYKCTDSWINDYRLNGFQPYHSHQGSVFSLALFLEGSENSEPLIFKSPNAIDMKNPMNVVHGQTPNYNEYNIPRVYYKALKGKMYVFRSYVEHAVDLKKSADKRIVLSANFDF